MKIFVNPAGQRDNLGDSVLRRPYLAALRSAGSLHVLAGNDLDYASGLGLVTSDVIHVSRVRWLVAAAISMARAEGAFALNAGEVIGSRSERRRAWWQSLLALIARVRSSPVLLSGVSVRPGTSAQATRLASLAHAADLVCWRDEWSRDQIGVGRVAPDWAFGTGGEFPVDDDARDLVAVSMRGDRPMPPPDWFDSVLEICDELNCAPVVVVQVRRDAEHAEDLAARLNADILPWPVKDDHATHEQKVRAIYRRSRLVVSDRIHALILGYTEGAVPAGSTTTPTEKIKRTFSPVTSLPIAPSAEDRLAERWRILISSRSTLAKDLAQARDALTELSHEIKLVVASRAGG